MKKKSFNFEVNRILEGNDVKKVFEAADAAELKKCSSEFQKAFKDFMSAWSDLLSAYEALDWVTPDLFDLFAEKYPFDKSFDDLWHDVFDWYENVVNGLDNLKVAKKDPISIKNLEIDLKAAIKDYMNSEGFDDKEAEEYSRVTIEITDDYYDLEVGAELSYDGLMKLSEKLDKVLAKYDKDAYFEAEAPGLLSARLYR